MLTKRIGKEKSIELALEVCGYCVAGTDGEVSHNELFALVCQALNCLRTYMMGTLQVPVTLNTIVKEMSLLEFAFDSCFPGYAASRLMRYTIQPARV